MAISYSDHPDTPGGNGTDEGEFVGGIEGGYTDNDTGVYRDFPSNPGPPVDPPEDSFATPPPPGRVPPAALWSDGTPLGCTPIDDIQDIGNDNDPSSPRIQAKSGNGEGWDPTNPFYYSDAPGGGYRDEIAMASPRSPYWDDPDSEDIRSRPSSNKKRTLGIAVVGFLLGILVMVVVLLVTGGDKTEAGGVRGGPLDGLQAGDDDHVALKVPDEEHEDMAEAEIAGDVIFGEAANEHHDEIYGEAQTAVVEEMEGSGRDGVPAEEAKGDAGETEEGDLTATGEVTTESVEHAEGEPAKAEETPAETTPQAEAAAKTEAAPPAPVVVPAPKPAPVPAPASNVPAGEVDMSIPFCGHCEWKHSHFTCDERVHYMVSKWSPSTKAARQTLMEQGHCPENRMAGRPPAPAPNPNAVPIPKLGDCRKRPVPEDPTHLDNFCPYCAYKNTDYSCIKRLQFVVSHYGPKTVKQAMKEIMANNHCRQDQTAEEKQKLKEQGLEKWCGMCNFRTHTCDGYSSIKGLEMKLDLMAHGQCILPPYCDEVEGSG